MNASSISKLLSNNGVRKQNVIRSGQIKGWANFSEGFVAKNTKNGESVLVTYEFSSSAKVTRESYLKNKENAFAKITALLTSKGYLVSLEDDCYGANNTLRICKAN